MFVQIQDLNPILRTELPITFPFFNTLIPVYKILLDLKSAQCVNRHHSRETKHSIWQPKACHFITSKNQIKCDHSRLHLLQSFTSPFNSPWWAGTSQTDVIIELSLALLRMNRYDSLHCFWSILSNKRESTRDI